VVARFTRATATIAGGGRSDRRPAAVVASLLVAPALVLLVRVRQSGWLSTSDWAFIESRTRDVGTLHTPLVGVYSRYGWNHPGPLLFYVLAIPYRIVGARGYGILVGALFVNAMAIAGIAVVLWRRGRLVGLLLGLAIVLTLARAVGAGFLIDPWNPYVIVFPLLAVVFLAWATADGDLWALPFAVGVGSFVTQSHVGAALAVIAAIGVAILVVVVDARRERVTQLKPVVLATAAVAAVCWLPPLVEQLQPDGGNLGRLISFWTRSHAGTAGWSLGARIVGQQLAVPAPWFSGHQQVIASTGGVDPRWQIPVALILLVIATTVAARTRDRQSLTLDLVAVALVLAAFFSVTRIVDTPFNYIVRWIWTVGAVVWLATLWTFWRVVSRKFHPKRVAERIGVAAIAALVAVLVAGAIQAKFPVQSDQRSLVGIAPAVRRELRELRGPILLEDPADFRSHLATGGVLLIAIHAGIDARLDRREADVVGDSHTRSEASARSIVVVAVDDAIDRYRSDPSYHAIAGYDPLSAAERAYRAEVNGEAQRALLGGIGSYRRWSATHRTDRSRVRVLDARGPRIELFLRARTGTSHGASTREITGLRANERREWDSNPR
jgi:hypothetical protein